MKIYSAISVAFSSVGESFIRVPSGWLHASQFNEAALLTTLVTNDREAAAPLLIPISKKIAESGAVPATTQQLPLDCDDESYTVRKLSCVATVADESVDVIEIYETLIRIMAHFMSGVDNLALQLGADSPIPPSRRDLPARHAVTEFSAVDEIFYGSAMFAKSLDAKLEDLVGSFSEYEPFLLPRYRHVKFPIKSPCPSQNWTLPNHFMCGFTRYKQRK